MRGHRREPLGSADYIVTDRGFRTSCWVRVGYANNRGYTKVTIGGRTMFAHRAMYEQEIGPIPDGKVLDHLCRQRDCIRPDHLEPVTDSENKRRGAGTKLSAAEVAAIRTDDRSYRVIAEEFGISHSHVSRIRAWKKWA